MSGERENEVPYVPPKKWLNSSSEVKKTFEACRRGVGCELNGR